MIVLDEVHERHAAPVLLGDARAAGPALRLVLMSATLNLELFSSFFGGAPVLRGLGAYPVDVVHVTADADVAVADAADGGALSHKMLPSARARAARRSSSSRCSSGLTRSLTAASVGTHCASSRALRRLS